MALNGPDLDFGHLLEGFLRSVWDGPHEIFCCGVQNESFGFSLKEIRLDVLFISYGPGGHFGPPLEDQGGV